MADLFLGRQGATAIAYPKFNIRRDIPSIRHFVSRSPAFAIARRVLGTYRRQKYERKIARFLRERTGLADRLPQGAVYEGTMRCNLHCGFCWVGDLLNLEGEWREELPLDALRRSRCNAVSPSYTRSQTR